MKKCVCCGRETYHKVDEQIVCAQCDVDGSFEYHLKQQAAQPLRAVDAASALPAEQNPRSNIVPAVEFDTQPRP